MSFLPKAATDLTGNRFIGIDLAKKDSQLSVLNNDGVEVLTLRFPTTRDNILALARELRLTDTIALEVTTNATAIARLIKAHSDAVVILSNPIKTRVIAVRVGENRQNRCQRFSRTRPRRLSADSLAP